MVRPFDNQNDSPADSRSLAQGTSVVIPVYNSEKSLPLLRDRLRVVLLEAGEPFEILLLDDASRDGSWRVIETLATADASVRGIRMMRNYGQHNVLLCGIRSANYSRVVTLDDDLQNPPEEIPRLLAALHDGYDVVYGVPERETHGLLRNLASQVTKIVLQNAMGAETARNVSAYRIFRTQLRDAFAEYRGPYVSIDVLLTWGTNRFTGVKVRHERRLIGQSHYTIGKLVVHAMNMMTGYSTLPLQMASIAGLIFTVFGIVILCFVVIRYLIEGSVVPGFSFIASLIVIFSGAQLFSLGIMGEYLARIHLRTMDRPSYTVRMEVGSTT